MKTYTCTGIIKMAGLGGAFPLYYLMCNGETVGCLDNLPIEAGTISTQIPRTREPVQVYVDPATVRVI